MKTEKRIIRNNHDKKNPTFTRTVYFMNKEEAEEMNKTETMINLEKSKWYTLLGDSYENTPYMKAVEVENE